MSNHRLAIDVGGTFVDFVYLEDATGEITIEKVSAAGQLETRFFEGIERLGIALPALQTLIHGSTLVINTIVQETGAPVGLITTAGFRDVLELGRGNRPEIYNLFYKPPPPLVPRHRRFEVPERINAAGEVLQPLDEAQARQVVQQLRAQGVAGIAICFLHAYLNPVHEQRMAAIVAEEFPQVHISTSAEIIREWREFERTSTTVLNAYTKPQMAAYLTALNEGLQERGFEGVFSIMQSSGGVTSGRAVRDVPIRTMQSGPAGGVIGAVALGHALDLPDLVSADVGGTTFDVALIVGGRALEKSSTRVNGRPVLQPTLDMVSIGAGGGSIAWIDREGGLRVGPHSAQADPGPACFGLGGELPTVTDAQVVLGYLDPDYYLGRRMVLQWAAAERAIQEHVAEPLGLSLLEAAYGIIHLTNMNMIYAIRNITIERGHDPRDFSLICFGGGGGLFAAPLLEELEMRRAIIPLNPATFSAWGLLNADFREDLVRTVIQPLAAVSPAALGQIFGELEQEARERLLANQVAADLIRIERFAEMRYVGQEHTVRVPVHADDLAGESLAALRARFDRHHEQAYAHALPTHAVEIVHLRVAGLGQMPRPALKTLPAVSQPAGAAIRGRRPVYFAPHAPQDCPIYRREKLGPGHRVTGPAIIEEWTSTTLVPPGHTAIVDQFGNLSLTVGDSDAG